MKRTSWLIALSLIVVLVMGITAQADMILEFQNNFLDWHRDDCKFYGRTHYINAPEGALGVYRKPNGKDVLGTLQNGEEVFISYTYGEETWGVIRFSVPGGATGGWIRMDQTVQKEENQTLNLYPASDIVIESEPIPAWILPTCLVAGVAVISFVVILVLKKKSSGD